MKNRAVYVFLSILRVSFTHEENDENLKEEIETVAAESKRLAEELAEMLTRLEVNDLREEAVESAVIGDDENVHKVLRQMVERINKLEGNTEDYEQTDENYELRLKSKSTRFKVFKEAENQDSIKIPSATKEKHLERLKTSLNNLEKVAAEIRSLALSAQTENELNAVNNLSQLLDSMSEKLNIDKIQLELDIQQGNEVNIRKIEKSIEKMFDVLVQAAQDVKQEHQKKKKSMNENQYNGYHTTEMSSPKEFGNKVDVSEKLVIRRKPKQLDDGLLDEEDVNDDDINTTSEKDDDESTDENESCRNSTATNTAKVCLPTFKSHKRKAKFLSKSKGEARHCFEV